MRGRCQVLTRSGVKDVYRFLSNVDVLGYCFMTFCLNLWGAPHMSSFTFMALCFPVSAKRCVCPLDSQPGANKPLCVEATATILSKLHHLSRSHQWNPRSAAAGGHLTFCAVTSVTSAASASKPACVERAVGLACGEVSCRKWVPGRRRPSHTKLWAFYSKFCEARLSLQNPRTGESLVVVFLLYRYSLFWCPISSSFSFFSFFLPSLIPLHLRDRLGRKWLWVSGMSAE